MGSTDDVTTIDASSGTALGGQPGGGDGYGGGSNWACGGGGGYSIISKRTVRGNIPYVVAGGGGGGGSIAGLPGSGLNGPLSGTLLDKRNGTSATVYAPGVGGDCGTTYNTDWPATDGQMWQGGNGSQFGAGGGGGYFGGGGGGTTPGVAGAGGGGSSFIYEEKVFDVVIIQGTGNFPGGLDHDPPEAVGVGEWDKKGGPVGMGGYADLRTVGRGHNGCVKIFKPGFY